MNEPVLNPESFSENEIQTSTSTSMLTGFCLVYCTAQQNQPKTTRKHVDTAVRKANKQASRSTVARPRAAGCRQALSDFMTENQTILNFSIAMLHAT